MMVSRMRLGLREQRALQTRADARIGAFAGLAHPQPEIGRHLVVARARGVQPPRGIADQLLQPRLDVEMDVFELAPEGERRRRRFPSRSRPDRAGSRRSPRCEMISCAASIRACAREPGDVLRRQPFVEIDGGVMSSMMAAGPPSKRPPHILFVLMGRP